MHSSKMNMAMATLVLGLLAALPSPTAVTMEKTRPSDCPDLCGDISIPYPFGIGPRCSLPGFNLTCAAGFNNTNLLLGNPSIEVRGFDWAQRGADYSSFPAIPTNIGYFVKLAPAQSYFVHWESPGRPFAISGSSNMALFVVGCSVKATLFIGDSGVELGNCYVACPVSQVGMGSCSIDIAVTLRSFTLNISRTSRAQGARGLEQVSVFVTDQEYRDLEFNSGEFYPAALSWAIPNQLNYKRTIEDKATYACVSNHSIRQEAPIGGYVCKCSQGFYGNPYVINGCVLPAPASPGSLSSHFSPISV